MGFARLGLVSLLALRVSAACAAGAADVTGYIGSHKLTFKAQSISKEAKFSLKGPADYLAVTEVYPDSPEAVTYRYRISGSGIGSFERSHASEGFGAVTYFLRVRNVPLGTVKIVNHSNGSKARPVLIQSIRPVKASELKSVLDWDMFTIMATAMITSNGSTMRCATAPPASAPSRSA